MGDEAGIAAHGAFGQHVVKDHGIHAAVGQVRIGMHVFVVRHGGKTVTPLGFEQQVVSHRASERRHSLAPEVGERAEAFAIGRTHRHHFAELVVRHAGGQRLAARGDVFNAAQPDVEVATPGRLIE